jgi:hypothetical protein
MITKFKQLLGSLSSRQRIAGAVTAGVVIVGAVVGVVVAGGSQKSASRTSSVTTAPPTTTTVAPGLSVPPGYCPLTDVKPAGGVPQRPALAVKVGNEPDGARPQAGLNEADIVFDTPAEGFIMRYIAVYQCEDASAIGPDRSVRWVDWHILRQFHTPIIAYAGGIGVNLHIVSTLPWAEADNLLGNAGGAGIRTTNRVPPDNLFTSTSALYALSPAFNKKWGPPPAIFQYSAAPGATATPAASMRINFSYGTDAIWTWSAALGEWVHSYADGPDVDTITNQPVVTTNVLALVVKYRFGRYAEHIGGSGDFESETTGSGTGVLLRNGKAIKITWHRRFLVDPWTLTDANGAIVKLAPGRTWVEIVPNTTAAAAGAMTITP